MSLPSGLSMGVGRQVRIAFLGLALLIGPGTTALAAQSPASRGIRVDSGVSPDTVTVGGPFRSALRLRVPAGYRVEFEEIAGNDTLEAVSPVQVMAQGDSAVAALFEMVAWMTGDSLAASASVRVTASDGTVTGHEIPLAMPVVASVLPAEDEAVEPRPVKGLVLPPGSARPFPWWWLLLAAAVTAALVYVWWRSRRGRVAPAEDPRQWALAKLDALLGEAGGAGDPVELYRQGSWVLRSYLARVAPRLGTDLTTSELVSFARLDRMEDRTLRNLGAILELADRVKFSAGHAATATDAREALQGMRALVVQYPAASQPVESPRRAA